MRHIDQYHGIAAIGKEGRFWRRLPDEEFPRYNREFHQGWDDGKTYSTPPHEDGECQQFTDKVLCYGTWSRKKRKCKWHEVRLRYDGP